MGIKRNDDIELQQAAGCIDLGLGFAPTINLIAIRRLSLAVGAQSQAIAIGWRKRGLFAGARFVYSRTVPHPE